MRIGIIGAGHLGQAFAHRAVSSGHEVVLSNNHGPSSLIHIVDSFGDQAIAGTPLEAASQEISVLAIPPHRINEFLGGIPDWGGRVLIDATNDLTQRMPLPGVLTSSENVAARASNAHVVKALNTLLAPTLRQDPSNALGDRRVLFISGDDIPSKEVVQRLLEDLEFSVVDLGTLSDGGRLQQFPGGPLSGLNLVRLRRSAEPRAIPIWSP